MSRNFQKTIEDFTCEHCGRIVAGSGFTNHCPKCLWSKHVDLAPGDRAAGCGGLMEPVRVERVAGGYRIVHHCARCGIEKANKLAEDDDFETVLAIAEKHSRGN